MLIDTDVLIWLFRGKPSAARLLEEVEHVALSSITYMELVQGMRDKEEFRLLRQTIHEYGWQVLPLDENISHRATVYIEELRLVTWAQNGRRPGRGLCRGGWFDTGNSQQKALQGHSRPEHPHLSPLAGC